MNSSLRISYSNFIIYFHALMSEPHVNGYPLVLIVSEILGLWFVVDKFKSSPLKFYNDTEPSPDENSFRKKTLIFRFGEIICDRSD